MGVRVCRRDYRPSSRTFRLQCANLVKSWSGDRTPSLTSTCWCIYVPPGRLLSWLHGKMVERLCSSAYGALQICFMIMIITSVFDRRTFPVLRWQLTGDHVRSFTISREQFRARLKPTSLSAPTHDSPPRTIEECNYLLTYVKRPL